VLFPWLVSAADAALRLASPPRCAACDTPLAADGLLCDGCSPGEPCILDRLPDGTTVVATARYDGAIAEVIRRFKYETRPDAGRWLGERIAAALRQAAPFEPTLLVPVPLHPKRLAERGYNQSALLAASAARALGCPSRPLALARVRDTAQQASLSRDRRLDNLTNAFVARGSLQGARVVLVDDVVTTGATAHACVSALVEAGAVVVAVAAVARAGRAPP